MSSSRSALWSLWVLCRWTSWLTLSVGVVRRILYPTHIPLNPIQKGAVAVLAAVGALVRYAIVLLLHSVPNGKRFRISPRLLSPLRPARGDLVAAVGETTGEWLLPAMRDRMRRDPVGQQILAERPRVTVRCILAISAMGSWSWRGEKCPACNQEQSQCLGGSALLLCPDLSFHARRRIL